MGRTLEQLDQDLAALETKVGILARAVKAILRRLPAEGVEPEEACDPRAVERRMDLRLARWQTLAAKEDEEI